MSQFTTEQIVGFLNRAKAGMAVVELGRQIYAITARCLYEAQKGGWRTNTKISIIPTQSIRKSSTLRACLSASRQYRRSKVRKLGCSG
jgi:hypothetical protein